MKPQINLVFVVVLRIYVAWVVFQPYRDLEAGDNQSLKFKWQGGESNPGPLAPQAKSLTARPPQLPINLVKQEAHVGHCRSPEYNERVKNLTSEWNQKQQSFIPHASRSLLCIRFVAVAFWAKKQFF